MEFIDCKPRRYVLIDNDDFLGGDQILTPEEADNMNVKLAAEGEGKRWFPFEPGKQAA